MIRIAILLVDFGVLAFFRSWDWISIKYTAHAGLGLGWTRKTWQFDKNENQQHILEIMNPILEKWRGMVVFGQSRRNYIIASLAI